MRLLTSILVTGLLLVPAFALAQEKPAPPAATKSAPVINLNTATAAQLETLPGVGAKTAARIIEYRQKNGTTNSHRVVSDARNASVVSLLPRHHPFRFCNTSLNDGGGGTSPSSR